VRGPRWILDHPAIVPRVAALLRSRIVDHSLRFALRELAGRRTTGVYRIRENGLTARVVHNTADINALDQSFYSHFHEPPPRALAALQALNHPVRALDVGANVGMWGLWLHSRLPVAHIEALEPDPVNVARHRRQIELNELENRWSVTERAATTADGPISFLSREGSTGAVVNRGTSGATTVVGVDLYSLLEEIDLLKVDIEGGEWPILADPRFEGVSVPVVMLEYHVDGAPPDGPRMAARQALERAGYAVEATEEFRPGFGTVWGHRQ
jgi:FkbM family methyltransferase